MERLVCCVPVQVRVVGRLDDERLRQLEEAVRRSVLSRLRLADEQLPGPDFGQLPTDADAPSDAADGASAAVPDPNTDIGGGIRIRTSRFRLLDTELRPPVPPTAVETATEALLLGLTPTAGSTAASGIWPHVTRQVAAPRTRRRRNAPPWLYEPHVVQALQALDPRGGERAEVLRRVLDSLLASRDTALGADPDPAHDAAAEWTHFGSAMQNHFEGGFEGYRALRTGFLVAFGALEHGTAQALRFAEEYYWPGSASPLLRISVFGHPGLLVHRELAWRLQAAEDTLAAAERRELLPLITSVGTLRIRSNRNNPLALSWHSFGAAVDINPTLSPNIPGFPGEFVRDVTGIDVRSPIPDANHGLGAVIAGLLGQEPDRALAQARAQSRASSRLTDVFRDEASLEAGVWEVAVRRAGPSASVGPPGLLAAVRAAAAEGPSVRWAYGGPTGRRARRAPHGVRHDELVRLLFPPSPFLGPEPFTEWEHRRSTVELLIRMVLTFEATFRHDRTGARVMRDGQPDRVGPTYASPTLGQIAAHGFLNIPDRIVAALTAPAPRGLRWLGSHERTTRDFMHFELRELPDLYPSSADRAARQDPGNPREGGEQR
ncbi:hypothetical protein [Streptomyces sp. NPDC056468]|uniref:hypothetical protein n=1 Tax=Streptomyces sp. NPDC056468 TaxID=3345830 RepID=UPI00367CC0D7